MGGIWGLTTSVMLCAAGLTILIGVAQGHSVFTILLRTSLLILVSGIMTILFLVGVAMLRGPESSAKDVRPGLREIQPTNGGKPGRR